MTNDDLFATMEIVGKWQDVVVCHVVLWLAVADFAQFAVFILFCHVVLCVYGVRDGVGKYHDFLQLIM